MDCNEKALELLEKITQQAEDAENDFDLLASEIERETRTAIDIFGNDATSRLVEITSKARRAGDELYATYQSLIKIIDECCRPNLENLSGDVIGAIANKIAWLNDESEIKDNFTTSVNGHCLGQVASAKYIPSMENKIIQKFWETQYALTPESKIAEQRAADDLHFRLKLREEQNRKAAEAEKRQKALEAQAAKQFEAEKERAKKHKYEIQHECETRLKRLEENLSHEVDSRIKCAASKTQEKLQTLSAKKGDLEKELSTLGFFNLKEKKALKKDLESITLDISNLQDELKSQQLKDSLNSISKKTLLAYQTELDIYLGNRFPYKKIKAKEQEDLRERLKQDNGDLEVLLYNLLEELGPSTINELIEHEPLLQDLSKEYISKILRRMMLQGFVNRSELMRQCIFDAVEDERPQQPSVNPTPVNIHEYFEDPDFALNPIPELPDTMIVFPK